MILTVARAFFRRGFLTAISYRFAFGLRLLAVAFSLGSFYYLAQFIDTNRFTALEKYGGNYLSFGLLGMVLLNLQHTAVSVYPRSVRQAQMAGTLEAMLATPTPSWQILICAPIYEFVAAFVWAACYLLAGKVLFAIRFDQVNLLSLSLAGPLCLVAFASLGFFGAAITMLLRRTDPLTFALGGLSTLLGGVFYPTRVLPLWLRAAGKVLPITHALEIVRRATFTDATVRQLAGELLGLGLFCAVAVPLGLAAFGWTLKRARQDGSLNHY